MMTLRAALLVALVLAASLAPAATAAEEAPDVLSLDDVTLYARLDPQASGNFGLSTEPGADGDGAGTGLLEQSHRFTMSSNPLEEDLLLAGELSFALFVGGGLGGQGIQVDFSLDAAGFNLVQGSFSNVTLLPPAVTPTGFLELNASTPFLALLPKGSVIQWTVEISGSLFPIQVGMGGEAQSSIAFPVIPIPAPLPPPDIDAGEVSGDIFLINHDVPGFTGSITYHWLSDSGNVTAAYSTMREEGSARIRVTDANGTTFFDEGTDTDGDYDKSFTGLVPGLFTIRIDYIGYLGTMVVFVGDESKLETPPPPPVRPDVPPVITAPPPAPTSNTTGPQTNEGPPEVHSKGSPGLAFPATIVALAAILLARRQK